MTWFSRSSGRKVEKVTLFYIYRDGGGASSLQFTYFLCVTKTPAFNFEKFSRLKYCTYTNKLGIVEILKLRSFDYHKMVFVYSMLLLYNSGFCSGSRIRKLTKSLRNGQTRISIEVKIGSFFWETARNQLLYAASAGVF